MKKVSYTNSKIYLVCFNKMLHNFKLIFSNIFTHKHVEIFFFLLLHLTSLWTNSTKFTIIIIINNISCPCVFFMIYFNVHLSILLSYGYIWTSGALLATN